MGSARSIPNRLTEETVRALAGEHYDADEFANLSLGKGYITSAQLTAAAQARGLGESLRANRSDRFFADEGGGGGCAAEGQGPRRGAETGLADRQAFALDSGYRSMSSELGSDDEPEDYPEAKGRGGAAQGSKEEVGSAHRSAGGSRMAEEKGDDHRVAGYDGAKSSE